jgi:hypothetical protein
MRLLPPERAAVLVRELEAAAIGISQVKTSRRSRVLDRAPYLAAELAGTVEDVLEAGGIDVEGDLVGVGRRARRLGAEEDDDGLPEPERQVATFELLGAGELAVEAAQSFGVRCSEGEMVDAEHSHSAFADSAGDSRGGESVHERLDELGLQEHGVRPGLVDRAQQLRLVVAGDCNQANPRMVAA